MDSIEIDEGAWPLRPARQGTRHLLEVDSASVWVMVSTMIEYAARRAEMVSYLGGKCAECGTTTQLQFDHTDSDTKSFDVSKNWARSWSILVAELDKCQLLCVEHHQKKSRENGDLAKGGGHNKLTECPHGTLYGYSGRWKCRCGPCREAKRKARRKEYVVRKDKSK